MARRTIGKPRFYADVLQYLKVLGYHQSNDNPELWNLDPTNNNEYNQATHTFNFKEDTLHAIFYVAYFIHSVIVNFNVR